MELSAFVVLLKEGGLSTLALAFVAYIIWQMLADNLVSGKRLEKAEQKNERLLTAHENQKETIKELTDQVKEVADSVGNVAVEQSRMNNAFLDSLRKQAHT